LLIEGEYPLECRLAMKTGDRLYQDIQIISETHAFFQGTIYKLVQAGVDHSTLVSFETLIQPDELEKYLSLFCSYCQTVEIRYKDFTLVKGERQPAKPAIIIEKITADGSLYLKVVQSIPGFDPHFCNQFDLTHVALVNDQEQQIAVREIEFPDTEPLAGKIRKHLVQLKNQEKVPLDFFQDENFFILEHPLSMQFVQQVLPRLIPEFSIFGAEKLQPYKVTLCKPELKLSLDHGIDFLEGSADLVVQGERFTLFEALHQFKHNAYVKLSDGTQAILDHDYVQKLERIFQKTQEKINVSFFDLPLVEELIEQRIEGKTYQDASAFYRGFVTLKEEAVLVPDIKATLRPYQQEGFKWLKYMQKNSMGGCLADDMGLGKTLQAITLLASIYPGETRPSLIVVPKSLVFNWLREIERFCPALIITAYHGSDRDLQKARTGHLILSTYGTVRKDIERLKDESFCYLILDESQYIKNHESQVSRAVCLLNAEFRLALSGTPIENNLSELYSLFRFLNPTMFGNMTRFVRQYLLPIQQAGNREIAKELKKKIYPFILRRLKKDVLLELPEKVENLIMIEMNGDQKRFYEQRRVFYYDTIRNRIESEGFQKSQFFVLQAITILRQIASIPEVKSEGRIISPKRELLSESLEEAVANDHKVLVFANFIGVLEYLAQDLTEKGIDFETLTGATRNRENPVRRFQSDPGCKVFLMTLKTGGQGLNLTAADTIYIFDPWWNLAAENQAIDRSHRIGQNKTVFSYKLIAKDTIEERMLHLQQKKKAVFETIISDESMSYQHLDATEIDYLMG
jgi:SNF2 family DNA or RNA helicase